MAANINGIRTDDANVAATAQLTHVPIIYRVVRKTHMFDSSHFKAYVTYSFSPVNNSSSVIATWPACNNFPSVYSGSTLK